MKSKKAITTMSMAEQWATELLKVKAQIRELELVESPLKMQVRNYLETATPTQRAILGGREFYLSERCVEQFDLKRARQAFKEKDLQPFIKLVSSKSLRHN